MHVFVTGASGLVGSRLVAALQQDGHRVTPLVRRSPQPGQALWNYQEGRIDLERLAEADAVVHLAGESVGEGRWTDAKKRRIQESRELGTRFLAESLAKTPSRPRVFVSASATGYYGDRGEEVLTEDSARGQGFLPDVCAAWEAACRPAAEAGARVANVRIGIVLSAAGGALPKMLLPFKLGVGGRVGSGRQWWSWIVLEDLLRVIQYVLANETMHGPLNATTPHPATNREFTKTLGKVLNRPTVFPVPAGAVRVALGQMANELLLASARVLPQRLEASGFQFHFPELEPALRQALGK